MMLRRLKIARSIRLVDRCNLRTSDSQEEIYEKAALLFDAGAYEVWICDARGSVTFLGPGLSRMALSTLCDAFPTHIDEP